MPDGRFETTDEEFAEAFERTVDEGERRLTRSWPALLATGTVGGFDVGVGIFALLVVTEDTGNDLLGALAFIIGFIAINLARSELFTENFLVPIAAMIARPDQGPVAVIRLWTGTLVTNLAGGWLLMAVVVVAVPSIRATAVDTGRHYPELGIGWEAFASAVLAGVVITLMTWMEHRTESTLGQLVAVSVAAFVLAAGDLMHVVVISLEMFAALIAGAPFSYADLSGMAGIAVLGNMVGGIGLVTVLRLVQVGRRKLEEEQSRPEGAEREESANQNG